jgi:hypothetical protein
MNAHMWAEELIALPPILLGMIHGGVRIFDQCLGIIAIAGIETDTDAHCDVNLVLIYKVDFS